MMKVSYIPFSKKKINPGYDLRNIILYSRLKNIKLFEYSDKSKNDYDVLILPPTFDPTNIEFIKKQKAKIIFQLVDNYLSEKTYSFKNIFRGIFNFYKGKTKKLTLNYKKSLQTLCKEVDGVICSSNEQQKEILKFNKNCHIFFEGNFHISNSNLIKTFDKKKIKLVWEGRSENLINLKIIKPVIDKLILNYNIELHILSDLSYPFMSVVNLSSIRLLKKIFGNLFQENTTQKESKIFFHQWNKDLVSTILKSCDIAVVPLDINNKFLFGKSMNKVILMWKNNLPVVASKINSYDDLSKKIKHSFCCSNENEWLEKIVELIDDNKTRENYTTKFNKYIAINYSENKFVKQWDDAITSVIK